MNFTLQQLRAFLTVAETLNFSAAAQRLDIRQPTLSASIKSLEGQVGARLFDRDTHRVDLTDFGRELQGHARRLLADVDRTSDDLRRRLQVKAGMIRLAALPYIFPSLLAAPLARFRVLQPEVAFQFEDVSTPDGIALLRAGHVDLVIANEVDDAPDIRYQFLAERRFVALMPHDHPLAAAPTLRWSDLADQALIVVQSRELNESAVIEPLRQSGLLPAITHRVHQLSTAVGLVQAGFGIAMVAQHTALHVLRPGFVAKAMVEPELVGKLSMMTVTTRTPSSQVQLLQQVLTDHFRRSRTDPFSAGQVRHQ